MAKILIIAQDAYGGRRAIESIACLLAVPAQIRGEVFEEVGIIGMIDVFLGRGQRLLYLHIQAAEVGGKIGDETPHVLHSAVVPVLLDERMIGEVYISQALIAG